MVVMMVVVLVGALGDALRAAGPSDVGASSAREPRAPHLTTPIPSCDFPRLSTTLQEQQGREFSFKPTVLGTLHRPEHINGVNGSQNGSETYTDNGSSASGYGGLPYQQHRPLRRSEHHSHRSLSPP